MRRSVGQRGGGCTHSFSFFDCKKVIEDGGSSSGNLIRSAPEWMGKEKKVEKARKHC